MDIEIFEKNICYIVVSHQSRLLKRADKILVLENGKVSNFGNSNEIIDKLQKYKCKLVRED